MDLDCSCSIDLIISGSLQSVYYQAMSLISNGYMHLQSADREIGYLLCKIGWKGVWYFEYFQDLLTLTRHIIHVTFILFNKYWLFLTRVDYYSAELWVRVMMFNATFNTSSVVSWWLFNSIGPITSLFFLISSGYILDILKLCV